jgi:hypothetical protein
LQTIVPIPQQEPKILSLPNELIGATLLESSGVPTARLGDDPGSPEIDPDRSDYPRLIRIDPEIDPSFDS